MSSSRVAVVVGVLAVVLLFALSSNTQQAPTSPIGEYQLVPVQYSVTTSGASWEQHTVFLLDSKSGQIWEYLPARKSADGKFHDAVLSPVKAVSP